MTSAPKSAEERKELLARQVAVLVARGRRVESQSDFQAVLVQGQRPNHTLHAILTIFTACIWGIIWAVVAGTGGEKRELVEVDEYGIVNVTQL